MASDPSPPALVLRADPLRAARQVPVAVRVSLAAVAGQVVAVEGANGSGKSTLVAAAAGLLPAGPGTRRPARVGYAPERADVAIRLPVRRWLLGLAAAAGLGRAEAARQVADVLDRMGLAHAASRPLRVLSRGDLQRALIAQALLGPPGLLALDEPAGGLDPDGVERLAREISRAAGQSAVVLVARHPTAPVPLPAGPVWRLAGGTVQTASHPAGPASPTAGGTPLAASPTRPASPTAGGTPLAASHPAGPGLSPAQDGGRPGFFTVETGDGVIRRASAAELPGVLRTALDAGVAIRRVEPLTAPSTDPAAAPPPLAMATPPGTSIRRAGSLARVMHGAAHRARLLTRSQWVAAPGLLFLAVLGIVYATYAGPPVPAAALTAVGLAPVMAWVSVLALQVDGRLVGWAFAAHIGGKGRAHLAASVATVPFALAATAAAWIWPALGQPSTPHQPGLLVQVSQYRFAASAEVITLHLAAAAFGVGVGTLLVPPLVHQAGWRICLASALFLAVLLIPASPMRPLLQLASHVTTSGRAVAIAATWLAATGLALIAVTSAAAARLR